MPKFRKQPVVIEAFQMTSERMWDNRDWPEWLHAAWNIEPSVPGSFYRPYSDENCNALCIGTLEGPLRVSVDDWIIQGVKGELYPCKPDIFEATYDAEG